MRFPVFGKFLKWVFQVCFRRFPVGRESLEVKKIIKVKFLWIIAATAGSFYEWMSVFLEKRRKEGLPWLWLWPLSDFTMALHSSKRWQSVFWNNRSITEIFLKRNNLPYIWYDTDTSQRLVWNILNKWWISHW